MSFDGDIKRFTLKLENGSKKTVKAITFQALKMITEETPKITGRAQGNWFIGAETPSSEMDESKLTPSYDAEMAKIKGNENNIYLTNNLPYAMRLETGYSRQRPNGMVAVSLERIKQHIESGKFKL